MDFVGYSVTGLGALVGFGYGAVTGCSLEWRNDRIAGRKARSR